MLGPEHLGNIFSYSNFNLGIFSIIFTILAVVGLINAINFTDGIDGLSSSFFIVALFSIILFSKNAQFSSFSLIFVLIINLFIYLFFNFGLIFKIKIFLGDAGSTFLGLGVAWSLVSFSQGDNIIFSPVIALWIFAVPLMDTLFVMINRVTHGRSPFSPYRKHLHHFFINSGRTDRGALVIIVTFSILMAFIGIIMELNEVSERVMFSLFLITSLIYYFVLRYGWKLIYSKNIHTD